MGNDLKQEDLSNDEVWKKSRIGLFIFAFPHLIFEQIMSELSETGGNFSISVLINFYVSRYFIKKKIYKDNKIIDNPIFYGLGISLIVFCIRVLLGFLASILFL
tara:strand:+ start:1525 stop:1836 length:312 start_codon:yes stop_codon:yes gene_type:complete